MALDAWRVRIRQAREREGLSRRDAAKKAGLSEGVWRNVETGVQHVAGVGTRDYRTTANTVARMASAVRLDPLEAVADAGLDVKDVHLDLVPDAERGDVRIILVRGNPSTDEVVAEVRRILDSLEQ